MLQVILDSNFLLLPTQFRLDIFEEVENLLSTRVEFLLPTPVYEELKQLSTIGGEKLRRQVHLALQLAKRCRLVPVERLEGESVDDLIVRLAQTWRCPVATNDRELRRRLREKGIAVIFLRDFSHLELEGYVE